MLLWSCRPTWLRGYKHKESQEVVFTDGRADPFQNLGSCAKQRSVRSMYTNCNVDVSCACLNMATGWRWITGYKRHSNSKSSGISSEAAAATLMQNTVTRGATTTPNGNTVSFDSVCRYAANKCSYGVVVPHGCGVISTRNLKK